VSREANHANNVGR
jgi:hypothetical protein